MYNINTINYQQPKTQTKPTPLTHLRRGTLKGSPEAFDKIRCPVEAKFAIFKL
jgi:hypothetical protein